jgi:hypothetical protein
VRGTTLSIGEHTVEVGTPSQRLHRGPVQAASRFRPLSRRDLRTLRPARVCMRWRNPCLRLRRRTFG